MNCILAFDKFKGSLTSTEAADIAACAVRDLFAHRPALADRFGAPQFTVLPTADGGEGTVRSLLSACGGETRMCNVTPPHVKPGEKTVEAEWGVLAGKDHACVMEMAAASGLLLVPEHLRDPQKTSSFGTGEMLLSALDSGMRDITLGIGGSATNDGGCGMAAALGARFYDENGTLIPCPTGADLGKIAHVDLSCMDTRIRDCRITVICDVNNPLTGERGASYVYAPQKGASADALAALDAGLANLAAVIRRDLGIDIAQMPGAGAAGGLGGGAYAFLGASLTPGSTAVLRAADAPGLFASADLVFTGEGCIDTQTLHGKTVDGVVRCAAEQKTPVIVIGGTVREGAQTLYERGAAAVLPITAGPMTLAEAMEQAPKLLYHTVYAAASLFFS